MNGVWCQVRIPMDDAVARAVVWVVAHVVVKSRFLDFCGLILIVSVFHIVVFEAMEMWVMGRNLGEVGVGGAPERLWENESARGEGCQKAVDIRDSGKRRGKGLKLSKGPTNIFGKFPGEKSGGIV